MAKRSRQRGSWGRAVDILSRAVVAALFSFGGVGCAGQLIDAQVKPSESLASPATLKTAARPVFQAGERLEAGVWLRGVPVGKVVTRVEARCGAAGDQAVEIRSDAKAAGPLSEIKGGEARVRSLVDLASGLPLSSRWWQQVTRPVEYELHFATDHYWAMSKRPTKSSPPRPFSVPSPVHDVHSALGLMRAWTGSEGEQQHFYLVIRRTLWRVEVVHRGACEVDTAGRERGAIRIDGVAHRVRASMDLDQKKPSDFALWLSDDAERIPLRMVVATKWGELDAQLLRRTLGAPRATTLANSASSAQGPPDARDPGPLPPPQGVAAEHSPAELPDGCAAELGPSEPMRQAIAKAERERQREKQRLLRRAQRAEAVARRAARAHKVSRAGRQPQRWASRRRSVQLRRTGRRGRFRGTSIGPDERVGGCSPAIDTSVAPLDSCGLVPHQR